MESFNLFEKFQQNSEKMKLYISATALALRATKYAFIKLPT